MFVISEKWKPENHQFEFLDASIGNWLTFILASVDQVINETIAYDKIPLITFMQYKIYLALKF